MKETIQSLLECPSEFEFSSVALGMPSNRMQCEYLSGHHGEHFCMYRGMYPTYWTDEQAIQKKHSEHDENCSTNDASCFYQAGCDCKGKRSLNHY